jgi:hypothetical protein
MKSLIFLALFSCSSFSAEVGQYLNYQMREIGQSEVTNVIERIVDRDDDFLSHLAVVNKPHASFSQWREDEVSYLGGYSADFIYRNCTGENFNGKLEIVSANGKAIPTCRLPKGNNHFLSGELILDESFDLQNSIVWIGPGPYNGIVKVVDYKSWKTYILFDYL